MEIAAATVEDAAEILSLQRLAYQSEAALCGDHSIPPLTQTAGEIEAEVDTRAFLKAVEGEEIVGSVRAFADGGTCFIGRLIVHPQWQGRRVGTRLMQAIEARYGDVERYELFTSTKSMRNMRLYERLGYRPFKEEPLSEAVRLVYLEKKASG